MSARLKRAPAPPHSAPRSAATASALPVPAAVRELGSALAKVHDLRERRDRAQSAAERARADAAAAETRRRSVALAEALGTAAEADPGAAAVACEAAERALAHAERLSTALRHAAGEAALALAPLAEAARSALAEAGERRLGELDAGFSRAIRQAIQAVAEAATIAHAAGLGWRVAPLYALRLPASMLDTAPGTVVQVGSEAWQVPPPALPEADALAQQRAAIEEAARLAAEAEGSA